ncbi:hypothetical protein HYV84_01965 [Candidatus Woesearchaeota archaeon]|nr:hypothetical protein [Candidatus Woesearchaeota archaeon]
MKPDSRVRWGLGAVTFCTATLFDRLTTHVSLATLHHVSNVRGQEWNPLPRMLIEKVGTLDGLTFSLAIALPVLVGSYLLRDRSFWKIKNPSRSKLRGIF